MKKVSVLFFALLAISASSIAKDAPILGNWLLTKVEVEGKTQEMYSEVNFKNDGYAEMEGRVFGTWVYNKKAKTVTITSEMIEEFSGEWKFTKPSKNEILLSGSKTELFFARIDKDKINANNRDSGFMGNWQVKLEEGTMYMKFTAPNNLSTYTKFDYGSSQGGGTWMASKDNNSLVLVFNDHSLSGKSTIKSITDSEFIIEKDGKQFKGEKLAGNTNDIENLAFTSDDIEESLNNNDIDVSLEATNSLWLDPAAKSSYLKDVKKLTYKYSSLLEGINIFIAENVVAKVDYNEDYDQITIEPIFEEVSARDESGNNSFYPIKELDEYRVTGEETITVPAGTFACTVIESIGDWENNKEKYYMIKNQPGVYAKIILVDGEGDEQKYRMFELSKIE